MSLPGVFGAVTYGLGRHGTVGELLRIDHITMLLSEMVASLPGDAGALPVLERVHPLLSALPGVLGLSWCDGAGGSEETKISSVLVGGRQRRSSAESSLSSSVTIPLPGVCGRSISSTVGDVGLLLISRSGSLSTKQPVGVRGLKFSTLWRDSTVHSGLSISTSRCDSAHKSQENHIFTTLLIRLCHSSHYSCFEIMLAA